MTHCRVRASGSAPATSSSPDCAAETTYEAGAGAVVDAGSSVELQPGCEP